MHKYISILLILLGMVTYAQEKTALNGEIQDTEGNSLDEVLIKVAEKNLQTFSRQNGNYFLELPIGNHEVSYYRLGYQTVTINVEIKDNGHLKRNIILTKIIQNLDQVLVKDQSSRIQGMTEVNIRNVSSVPNTSQNFESLLKQLPGVSTNNELSSQYTVRGGNFDENLIYINDVEIFKPYLVRNGQQEGLSLINPDLVGNVKFSAGGFNVKYGDKLSSVLDIKYKTQDSIATIIGIGTNAISATTFLHHKKWNLNLGFRTKRNQFLLKKQGVKGSFNPQFYDFQGNAGYEISKKLNIQFLGIVNKSDFSLVPESKETKFGTLSNAYSLNVVYEGQEKDQYQNLVGALTLNYKISKNANLKWINSAFLMKEKEHFDILGSYIFEDINNDFVDSGNVKANRGIGVYQTYGRNQLDASVWSSDLKFNFHAEKSFWESSIRIQRDHLKDELLEFNYIDSAGYSLPYNFIGFPLEDAVNATNDIEIQRFSGYLMQTNELNEQLTYTAGIRFNYNNFTKEFIPSPRVSLTYIPSYNDVVYRFSTGLYVQSPFYREMRSFNGEINKDVKAQKSIHFVVSQDRKFEALGSTLRFTSEAYYKVLYHLTPYEIENLRVRYFADKMAKGYAAGLDFSLVGELIPDLESSFRLSLMKTQENIEGDNIGFIKRPTDQRVNFSAFFQDRLFNSPTYKMHLNILFGSKLPTWPPKSEIKENSFYIPSYRRLDVGFSKNLFENENRNNRLISAKYFKSLTLYAEVFNLLNLNNTVSYLWITDVSSNRYAIPNYLTSRQLNFRIIAKF
jgi:hypothetical protein